MAGLDPAIHTVRWPPASARNVHSQGTRNPVDARVTPGQYERGVRATRSRLALAAGASLMNLTNYARMNPPPSTRSPS
jgi:hypothetical protein